MSMNLHLRAEREVVVKKTGKVSHQYKNIDLIQTPTEVTYKLMEAENIFEAYKEFVLEHMDIDFWKSNGEEIYNEHKEELLNMIKSIETWIKEVEEEGYEIKFYVM